jgi:RND family efflux transporter MFP subunit
MPSRFFAGAAVLAITLSAGHAWGETQDARSKAARKPQNAATITSLGRAQLTPLGATLESVLAFGRQLNPALRAAALETSAAAAKASGADALDTPTLSDSYQYYRNPNVFSGHAVMVTQAFPLWGKRDLRREAALADLDAARGREQAARDALDERIKIAFAQYYAASRALGVNQEVIAVTRGMRSTAEARYAAGTGDQAAAIRVLGEETSASIETARLEGDRAAAREVLNALLARPANAPLADPLRLRRLPVLELAIASLVERARGSNPSLAASGAEVSAARSRAALAEKAWYPDLTVGAGPLVQTNNRPPGVAATIGLNIPLPWGREASEQQAAVGRGRATLRGRSARYSERAGGGAREAQGRPTGGRLGGSQGPSRSAGGAQVGSIGLFPRRRRSRRGAGGTAPGPRSRTQAAPGRTGRADGACRDRTFDRGRAMIGARASGVVLILVVATACTLVGAAAQPPEASETLGSPEAGQNGPKASEPNLAPLTLTPQRMQSIGVKTGVVERRKVQDEIRTVGNVEADETRLADVQVRFSGWVQKVYADATYKTVRQGQPLLTIYSPDLVTAEQEYLVAKELLTQSGTHGGGSHGSASLLSAATERLKRWQIPEREIARLKKTGKVNREIEIDSPVSGVVIDRKAFPNMYVEPSTKLYAVADLSTVWVYAEVFQNDIGKVKVGDPASITVDAYPGETFPARVSFIWPEVDRATRRARVRLEIPNPQLKLLLGMYVDVRIRVPLGDQLAIPAGGVFQSGTRQIAFVDHGGGSFEPRDIELGLRAGDDFVVLKGLKAGERIVTSANFLIDSESQLQAALGSFAPPPPSVGAAAAMNAPQGATLEYSSNPSTPRAGSNNLRVKLAGADGAAITGAQVTVTFFMPAMPAMGMAAMRSVATLNEKGGGIYEGPGEVQMGGTWQVTVLATKSGQTIAQKQVSVAVEGGM